MDLVIAMLGGGLSLVEPCQAAIVALIQAPMLGHWQPHTAHFRQRQPQCANGAGLDAGEGSAEISVARFQQFSGFLCFRFALLGQVGIPPTRETVLQIPFGLAMTDEREFGHENFLLIGFRPFSRQNRSVSSVHHAYQL